MMMIAAVFVTVLVCGVLSSDDCPLPESSIYEPRRANYDSSQMFCSSANGQLLKINNAYENSIAVNILYEGGRCRPGWSYFADTNQCYWIGGNATYYDALKECTVLGANLASLHSLGESNFILGLTITTPNYCDGDPYGAMRTWIGGYYNEDKWVWADGTKYDFDYVYDDADSSGSLAIVTNTDCNTFTLWNSYEPSSKMLYFVCKMQAF